MSDLVGNPEDQYSCVAAHLVAIITLESLHSVQNVCLLFELMLYVPVNAIVMSGCCLHFMGLLPKIRMF